jgi:nucleotide-binding universal stress UspA family protein
MARIVSTEIASCHVGAACSTAAETPDRVTSATVGPVICAVDDSDGARAATTVARDLASRLGSNLVLLHVEPPTTVPGVSAAVGGQQRLRRIEIDDAEKLLSWLAEESDLEDVDLQATVGDAAESIVSLARELEAAFVVLGSHGRRGLRSTVLGSVSNAVATSAPCPVVVVPPSVTRA